MTRTFVDILWSVLPILVSLGLGMAAGLRLRRRPGVLASADRLATWAVFVLLFLLGMTTGLNREAVARLHELGLQALAVTAGAVAGSLLLGVLLYAWLFREAGR